MMIGKLDEETILTIDKKYFHRKEFQYLRVNNDTKKWRNSIKWNDTETEWTKIELQMTRTIEQKIHMTWESWTSGSNKAP